MMNDIFRTLIAEVIVVVYLDDILIFTKMEEEYERAVQRVLEVLAEHKTKEYSGLEARSIFPRTQTYEGE